MEQYFDKFRKGIIGINAQIDTQEGTKDIVYADWTASGRNYAPIEQRIQQHLMPLVANTHTETSTTGMAMTHAYHEAQGIIKKHVNAHEDDLIITATSGMTRLINKLQRILGLKYREAPPEHLRPVVFITHMEHHSNQTSWLETLMTVEIIQPNDEGLVDLNSLDELLEKYKDRPLKIASVTACSNVTGIVTPYHQIAQKMHRAGGYCFVDFACSAPYVDIDMHPTEEDAHLDAIFFSPHKFLGGPGSAGVLIFNRKLYQQRIPDNPGGGTVDWTNPWGKHKYVDNIEAREDGGTPAFLQTIKTAMCVTLKEEMGVDHILKREHELIDLLWDKVANIPNVHILASQHRDRLAILSFYIEGLHYNSGVKLLNDKFGIQSRGGCSCAGTYGHYLLNVDPAQSQQITDMINQGDFSHKPGWIRVSLHPTMTNQEVEFIAQGIEQLAKNHKQWCEDYGFEAKLNGLSARSVTEDKQLKESIYEVLTANFADDTNKLSPGIGLRQVAASVPDDVK